MCVCSTRAQQHVSTMCPVAVQVWDKSCLSEDSMLGRATWSLAEQLQVGRVDGARCWRQLLLPGEVFVSGVCDCVERLVFDILHQLHNPQACGPNKPVMCPAVFAVFCQQAAAADDAGTAADVDDILSCDQDTTQGTAAAVCQVVLVLKHPTKLAKTAGQLRLKVRAPGRTPQLAARLVQWHTRVYNNLACMST